ncbi:MAG: transcriptional regulator [Firmicutes bacterium HGW-Firmicutes-1]|jgi:mannose-6-phosphate isomerase-like protein (cupin superfamily)|nr:MAG: transcriptional regulator [Firmicutes bacterium HGW-Firmicutes-1]
MSNLLQIKEISIRMKDLREIYELSEESLAKQLNVDLEVYKNYENAICDIPIGFLYDFANRFKVELMTLLTGDEPRLLQYEVVRKGQGLKIDRRKQYDYSNLAYNFIGKKLEPFLVTVPPTDEATAITCSHHEGQEFNYLLEGKMKMIIGKHEVVLEAGDAIYFNSNSPHGMKALGGAKAQFLAIIAG